MCEMVVLLVALLATVALRVVVPVISSDQTMPMLQEMPFHTCANKNLRWQIILVMCTCLL